MSRIVPFALILLSQLCDLSIAAQSLVDVPELASFVREPYEGLDPDQIPTGYLVDAAIAIAPLTAYDGSPGQHGEAAVTSGRYQDLFATAASSSVSEEAFELFRDRPHLAYGSYAGSTAHLTGLIYEYNVLSEEAISNGWVAQDPATGLLTRRSTLPVYDAGTAAVFATAEAYVNPGAQTYVFERGDLVTNTWTYSFFEVDRGRGFERIDFGESFTFNPTSTNMSFMLRITTGFGTVYGEVEVRVKQNRLPISSRNLCGQSVTPFDGGTITALLNVSGEECDDSCILDNPLIVVNGFDDGNEDQPRIERLVNEFEIRPDPNSPYAGSTLRELLFADAGYDILFVDFTDGTASNFTTAEWLIDAMAVIEEMKEEAGIGGMNVPMIGTSMGGLVSKIALSQMEKRSIPHHVDQWFTFDSPLRGAYIPIGLQHTLHHFARAEIWGISLFDFGLDSDGRLARLEDKYRTLTSDGATEMLIYSAQAKVKYRPGFLWSPRLATIEHSVRSDLHDTFQSRLDAESHGVPHYAISNGARNQDQTEVEPGEVADLQPSTTILTINLNLPGYALPTTSMLQYQHVKIEARTLPRAFKLTRTRWPLFSSVTYRANHETINPNLDLVAGGTRPMDNIDGAETGVNYYQFIPSTSAQNLPLDADLSQPGPGVSYSLIPTNELLDSRTDDDFLVFNHEHVAVTPQIATFLVDALTEVGSEIQPNSQTTQLLTRGYNFGSGFIRGLKRKTPNRLSGTTQVLYSGYLGVNQPGVIGFVDVGTNPTSTTDLFTLRLVGDECSGDGTITVASGGQLLIGSPGRPATLIMDPGTEINAHPGGRIVVAKGSKLVVGQGSKLNAAQASVIVEGAVEVMLGGVFNLREFANLSIREGGHLRVSEGSSFSVRDRSNITISDSGSESSHLIFEGGTLVVHGTPNLSGDGELRFLGISEVKAYQPFVLKGGQSYESRLRVVLQDATLSITETGNVEFASLIIEYLGTSVLRPKIGASVRFENVEALVPNDVYGSRSVAIQAPSLSELTLQACTFKGFHRAVDINDEPGHPRTGSLVFNSVVFRESEVFVERVGNVDVTYTTFISETIKGRLDVRDAHHVLLQDATFIGFTQGYKPTLAPAAARFVDVDDLSVNGVFRENDLGLQAIRCKSVDLSCAWFYDNFTGAFIEEGVVDVDRSWFYSNTSGLIGSDIDLKIRRTSIDHDCADGPLLRLRYNDYPLPSYSNPVVAEYNLWNGSTAAPSPCYFEISYLGNIVSPAYVDTYPSSTQTGCLLNGVQGRSSNTVDSAYVNKDFEPIDPSSLDSVPSLTLAPNPANHYVRVSFMHFDPASITVYDATGRPVSHMIETVETDLTVLPDGLYRVVAIDLVGDRLVKPLAIRH